MVLVTLGTQPINCDRIIETILKANIKEKIVIQAYYNYVLKDKYSNVDFYKYFSYDEMDKFIDKANIIITSGTGTILRALLKNKKVIIFPRLADYKEAVDNHGEDMKILAKKGYLEYVDDPDNFTKIYKKCLISSYKPYESNAKLFIADLRQLIAKL